VTADVAIRRCVADDAAPLAAMYAADRDDPTLGASPSVFFTPDGQRDRINRIWPEHDCVGFVAVRGDDLVGLFVLEDIVQRSAVVGYYVAGAARGGGVATTALGALVRVARDELGLDRLVADIAPDNVASRCVVEQNDFVATGAVVVDGATFDRFVVRLSRWEPVGAPPEPGQG
jgi:ribosomal-protein-alanine N-acetyltransferase